MKIRITILTIIGVIISLTLVLLIIIINVEPGESNLSNSHLSIYKYEHTGEVVYSEDKYLGYKNNYIVYDEVSRFYWIDDTCMIYVKNRVYMYEDDKNKIELFDFNEYDILRIVKRDEFIYFCTSNKEYYRYNVIIKKNEIIDESLFSIALYGDFYRIDTSNKKSIDIYNIKDSSHKSILYSDIFECDFILEMKKMNVGKIEYENYIIDGENIFIIFNIGYHYQIIMKYDYVNETYDYYDWLNVNLFETSNVKIFLITKNVGTPLQKYFHF